MKTSRLALSVLATVAVRVSYWVASAALIGSLAGCGSDEPAKKVTDNPVVQETPTPAATQTPVAAAALKVQGPTTIAAGSCQAYGISGLDANGGEAPVPADLVVNISRAPAGDLFSDAACSATAKITKVTGAGTFYMKPASAGSIKITATATGLTGSDLNVTVTAGSATRLAIASTTAIATDPYLAGDCQKFSVTLRDGNGNIVTPTTAVGFAPMVTPATSPLKFYSNDTCTTLLTTSSVASTASPRFIWSKTTKAETVTLTVNDTNGTVASRLGAGTLTQAILPGAASRLGVIAPDEVVPGACNKFTVKLRDTNQNDTTMATAVDTTIEANGDVNFFAATGCSSTISNGKLPAIPAKSQGVDFWVRTNQETASPITFTARSVGLTAGGKAVRSKLPPPPSCMAVGGLITSLNPGQSFKCTFTYAAQANVLELKLRARLHSADLSSGYVLGIKLNGNIVSGWFDRLTHRLVNKVIYPLYPNASSTYTSLSWFKPDVGWRAIFSPDYSAQSAGQYAQYTNNGAEAFSYQINLGGLPATTGLNTLEIKNLYVPPTGTPAKTLVLDKVTMALVAPIPRLPGYRILTGLPNTSTTVDTTPDGSMVLKLAQDDNAEAGRLLTRSTFRTISGSGATTVLGTLYYSGAPTLEKGETRPLGIQVVRNSNPYEYRMDCGTFEVRRTIDVDDTARVSRAKVTDVITLDSGLPADTKITALHTVRIPAALATVNFAGNESILQFDIGGSLANLPALFLPMGNLSVGFLGKSTVAAELPYMSYRPDPGYGGLVYSGKPFTNNTQTHTWYVMALKGSLLDFQNEVQAAP